jgi:tetratricopeptide (TPR) repeat protein
MSLLRGLSTSPQRDERLAEQLLLEAIERDASSPLAHFWLGDLRRTQNRLAEARIEFETTISFDRNYAPAIFQLGLVSMFLGQPDAAIPAIENAMRLNPHDPLGETYYWSLGFCYLLLGRLNELMINLLRKACSANPRMFYHHLSLAGALGLMGDLDDARAAVAEAIKLRPEVNSLARIRAQFPWGNPQFWSLFENTVAAGLRRAGFPAE